MLVWRISSAAWSELGGEGARLAGGRWNSPGTPVVYMSATLSLAALELFVHLDPEDDPNDLIAGSAEIPPTLEIEYIRVKRLTREWRQYPAPEALAEIGTQWVGRGKTPILCVPSAVIPQERNYLLNPAHADFGRIRVNDPVPFHLDPRMWKARPLG